MRKKILLVRDRRVWEDYSICLGETRCAVEREIHKEKDIAKSRGSLDQVSMGKTFSYAFSITDWNEPFPHDEVTLFFREHSLSDPPLKSEKGNLYYFNSYAEIREQKDKRESVVEKGKRGAHYVFQVDFSPPFEFHRQEVLVTGFMVFRNNRTGYFTERSLKIRVVNKKEEPRIFISPTSFPGFEGANFHVRVERPGHLLRTTPLIVFRFSCRDANQRSFEKTVEFEAPDPFQEGEFALDAFHVPVGPCTFYGDIRNFGGNAGGLLVCPKEVKEMESTAKRLESIRIHAQMTLEARTLQSNSSEYTFYNRAQGIPCEED